MPVQNELPLLDLVEPLSEGEIDELGETVFSKWSRGEPETIPRRQLGQHSLKRGRRTTVRFVYNDGSEPSAQNLQIWLQRQRLHALVSYSYERVPYYRRMMNEAGLAPEHVRSVDDLRRLPVLTRDMVRANSSELLADGFPGKKLRRCTTGGSTGAPLVFYSTIEDQVNRGYARGIRAVRQAGIAVGDRRMLIRMRRESLGHGRGPLQRISRILERVHELDARDITTDSLPGIVAFLDRPDVEYLGGYPSAVSFIAAWIAETGTK